MNLKKGGEKEMKTLLGGLLIVSGIGLGLFVGGYLCAYGGIVQAIHGATADPINASAIAIGVIRFFAASLAGYLSALVLVIPGIALLRKEAKDENKKK